MPKKPGKRTEQDMGVPPSGSGLRPYGVEPQASQAEPLVPNAVDEALKLIPLGWQYEISNNAIDRGWSRSVGPDGKPDDTVEELGPWCALQFPRDLDCFGEPDWFGLILCGGSGGESVASAIVGAVENIGEKGHIEESARILREREKTNGNP